MRVSSPEDLSVLLDRVLEFPPTRTAEHAMIPRPHTDLVDAALPASEVLALMSTGHTRYPVSAGTDDEVRGVIHLHDLLEWSHALKTEPAKADLSATAGDLCRRAVVVPLDAAVAGSAREPRFRKRGDGHRHRRIRRLRRGS